MVSYEPANPPIVYDYAWLLSELARIADALAAIEARLDALEGP